MKRFKKNLFSFKFISMLLLTISYCIASEVATPEFSLSFKYTSSWDNGFVGVVTAKNTGDTKIEDWEISFKGNFGISEEWNAFQVCKDTLNGGFRYNFKCADWNKVIHPGKSVSFGFTAEFIGELPKPHNMKLNNISDKRGEVQVFFADWSNYLGVNPNDLPLQNIDKITHAFAVITEEGAVTHGNRETDIEILLDGDTSEQPVKGNFNQYAIIKKNYPNIKVMISIIARNHNKIDYKRAAATSESRRKFTLSAINFMQKFNFDGINIDWEFPEADDKDNLTELIKVLRSELDRVGFESNKHYELSFASPIAYYLLKDIDLAAITPYLDEVSIMGFNYFGPWENHAGHNSPLYHNISDDLPFPPEVIEYLKNCNIDWTVKYHLDNGVPSHKIVLGMPIYSHNWVNVIDQFDIGGLYSEGIGKEPIYYNQVLSLYHDSGYTRYWDDLSKTSYFYHPGKNGGHFVTFDDTASIKYKCEYINENYMKGASFWMGAFDVKGEESLIIKSSETLNKPEKNDSVLMKKVKAK